jgi:hypothetical protein
LLQIAAGELESDLHSAVAPSPICIVAMIVGVIMIVGSFLFTVVSNVWGVLTIGVSVLDTVAVNSGSKMIVVFHPGSEISDPLYSIELSWIVLSIFVGAVLAMV